MPPLPLLACADTAINELVLFGICGLIIVGTTLGVLISYAYITVTILRMRSGAGRHKLFSTCGSHMTAVSLFYGTGFVMYAQPGAVESMEQGKVVSVFYTLVIPVLNPLIYSLQNKDVKDALRSLGHKHAPLIDGDLGDRAPWGQGQGAMETVSCICFEEFLPFLQFITSSNVSFYFPGSTSWTMHAD